MLEKAAADAPGVITGHRGHISSPHLLVLTLHGRNRRRVLPEQIRHHQPHHRRTIGRHQRRINRRRPRRLKRSRHRRRLRSRPQPAAAAAPSHPAYGAAAATIAADAGPCHA